MTEFKVGQRVHVEFDGVIDYIVDGGYEDGNINVRRADGYINTVLSEHITSLEPASWPPQLGDIWEADGTEYYIRNAAYRADRLYAMADHARYGYGIYNPEQFEIFKALNPTLVRRRGE